MTASSIRSNIVAAAAAAAIADIAVVIIALLSGASLAAFFAVIAGLVAIGGASYAANRAAAAVAGNAKQLDRANGQVEALTRQLSDVADYLNRAGATENGSNPMEALSAAKDNIEVVAEGSISQLEKSEKASTVQSPGLCWRNSRAVGYQGLSGRSSSQRQS